MMNRLDKISEQLDLLRKLVDDEKDKPTSRDKEIELQIIATRIDRIILHFEECITEAQ